MKGAASKTAIATAAPAMRPMRTANTFRAQAGDVRMRSRSEREWNARVTDSIACDKSSDQDSNREPVMPTKVDVSDAHSHS